MFADRKMLVVAACLYVIVQLCSALDPTCTVTHDAQQTTYSISDHSQVFDKMATGCEYSWTDASNYVLADHMDKIPLVTLNSISTLVASKCLGNMTLTRRCFSEGKDYTVSCPCACSKDGHDFPIVVIVSCTVAALVLLLAVLTLCCYKKRKSGRVCSCMQTGGLYNPVKMQSGAPEAVP